jgi:hypothetical protein
MNGADHNVLLPTSRVSAESTAGFKTAKPSAASRANGFAFFPTNADFREGIVGAVELAMGGETPALRPPCVGAAGSGPTRP